MKGVIMEKRGRAMGNYVKENIPYSLLETDQIERFLTDKARDGLWLKKTASFYPSGKFEDRPPGICHYAAAMYGRRVTGKEKEAGQFKEFCRKWEECGWEYVCPCQCLVIFSSQEEERPPEPDSKASWKMGEETMLQSACRTENLSILVCVAGEIPITLFYLFLLVHPQLRRGNPFHLLFYVLIGCLLSFLWITAPLERKLRQKKARDYLMKQHGIPDFDIFGMEGRLLMCAAIVTGLVGAVMGVRELSVSGFRLSLGAVLASVLLLWISLWPRWRARWRDRWFAGLLRLLGAIPMLMVLLAVFLIPSGKNYRYMRSEAKFYDYNDSKRDQVAALGLSPEDIGFGEEWGAQCVSQPNLVCTGETVIYREEMTDVDYRRKDYGKALRYVGTIKAELKKPGALERYLEQKKLSLDGSVPLELGGRRDYYLTKSGKEIIGVDGNDVVIYFLNQYDERSFQADDPKLLSAVKRLESRADTE